MTIYYRSCKLHWVWYVLQGNIPQVFKPKQMSLTTCDTNKFTNKKQEDNRFLLRRIKRSSVSRVGWNRTLCSLSWLLISGVWKLSRSLFSSTCYGNQRWILSFSPLANVGINWTSISPDVIFSSLNMRWICIPTSPLQLLLAAAGRILLDSFRNTKYPK